MSCVGMGLAKTGWIEQTITMTPATATAIEASRPRLFLWNPFTAIHSPLFPADSRSYRWVLCGNRFAVATPAWSESARHVYRLCATGYQRPAATPIRGYACVTAAVTGCERAAAQARIPSASARPGC